MKNTSSIKPQRAKVVVYIILLLLVIIAMTAIRVSINRHTGNSATSEATDTIHAAIVYGPTSFRVLESEDGNDSIIGINYHLLTLLQDSLGIPVVKHPVINRDEALAKLASGEYDILASLPADNHLKKNFLTSEEVYLDRLVLIQKKAPDGKLKVKSALDIEEDTIHVEQGSAATRRLENLQKEIGGNIHIKEESGLSEEYLAMKVGSGAWDFAVVNERTAQDMQALYPDLDFSTPVSFTQFQVWVLPHSADSLLSKVNRFLNSTHDYRKSLSDQKN